MWISLVMLPWADSWLVFRSRERQMCDALRGSAGSPGKETRLRGETSALEPLVVS